MPSEKKAEYFDDSDSEVLEKPKAKKPKPKKPRAKKAKDDKPKKPRKPSPWLLHVAAFRESHPDLSYKECLKQAKETYTPVKLKKKSPDKSKAGAVDV